MTVATLAWQRRTSSAPAQIDNLHFVIREPFEVYQARNKDYLSSHQLADFREAPTLFHKERLGMVPDEDRPAFIIGRAAHTLILEGRDEYRRRYAFGGPINPTTGRPYDGRTKAFQEWAERQGKPTLTDSQTMLVEQLADAVERHDVAQDLLSVGIAEGVVRGLYRGLMCQSRIDWLNPCRGIVDLKTCDNLTYLEADAKRFGYLHQLAFYHALLRLEVGTDLPVFLIAVEKREPFRCGVWHLGPNVLAIAQQENEQAMERLSRCQRSNVWLSGYEDLRLLDHV